MCPDKRDGALDTGCCGEPRRTLRLAALCARLLGLGRQRLFRRLDESFRVDNEYPIVKGSESDGPGQVTSEELVQKSWGFRP